MAFEWKTLFWRHIIVVIATPCHAMILSWNRSSFGVMDMFFTNCFARKFLIIFHGVLLLLLLLLSGRLVAGPPLGHAMFLGPRVELGQPGLFSRSTNQRSIRQSCDAALDQWKSAASHKQLLGLHGFEEGGEDVSHHLFCPDNYF